MDDIEDILQYLDRARETADETIDNLNVVTEYDIGTVALNNRAISLLNRSIDLKDAIKRFQKAVEKRA